MFEAGFTCILSKSLMNTRTNGSIAQLGEHLPYKQRVTGSSPVVPTIHKQYTFVFCLFF